MTNHALTTRVTEALVFASPSLHKVSSASQLSAHLVEHGATALASLSSQRIGDLWNALVEQLLQPNSEFWQTHCDAQAVGREFGLHPKSFHAALKVSLPGLRVGERQLTELDLSTADKGSGLAEPVLAVLAGNVPILPLQVLLPALLARQPIAFKLPSTAPNRTNRQGISVESTTSDQAFLVSILGWLVEHEPRLEQAVAVLRWRGGQDTAMEAALMAASPRFGPVLIYGGADAVQSYQEITEPGRLLLFGPKTSIALVVDDGSANPGWLSAVASDVALFEQRGCLSVTTVLLVSSAPHETPAVRVERGQALATALNNLTQDLPLPTAVPLATAQARHWIDTAHIAGQSVWGDLASGGTVVSATEIHASPQCRTVNLVEVRDLETALALIERRQAAYDDLQGVSVAGLKLQKTSNDGQVEGEGEELRKRLRALGISRITEVGRLQATDHGWHNGGVGLLAALQ